jgi:uncharacterized protein involved in outer membrane biogenesis
MSTAAAAAVVPRYHRWPAVLGSFAAVVAIAMSTGEVMGWPFLAAPMQRWLSDSLHRRVSFEVDGRIPASVAVRLLGRVRIDAPLLTIGAPPWADAPTMLRARDAVMSLRYLDLWRAREGAPMHIRLLEAAEFDVDLLRLADGRASWRFTSGSGPAARSGAGLLASLPVDQMKADVGTLRLRDQPAGLQLILQVNGGSTSLGATRSGAAQAAAPSSSAGNENAGPSVTAGGAASGASTPPGVWVVEARGEWRGQPLRLTLDSNSALPWIDAVASMENATAHLQGSIGESRIDARTPLSDVRGAALIISRWLHEAPPGPAQ